MLCACEDFTVHHVSAQCIFVYSSAPLLPTCAQVKMRENCITVFEKQLTSVLWITPCSSEIIVRLSWGFNIHSVCVDNSWTLLEHQRPFVHLCVDSSQGTLEQILFTMQCYQCQNYAISISNYIMLSISFWRWSTPFWGQSTPFWR